jgi:hypothetical protein
MSVSSISSSSAAASLQKALQPEALEPRRVGPDHDGDADDRVGAISAPKPVVNTSGQTTGLVINTKA